MKEKIKELLKDMKENNANGVIINDEVILYRKNKLMTIEINPKSMKMIGAFNNIENAIELKYPNIEFYQLIQMEG